MGALYCVRNLTVQLGRILNHSSTFGVFIGAFLVSFIITEIGILMITLPSPIHFLKGLQRQYTSETELGASVKCERMEGV